MYFSIICSGCVFFGASNFKNTNYKYTAPSSPWLKADPGTADVVFQNADDRTTISVNSVCEQYQDLSLEELTRNLLQGIRERTLTKSEKLQLHTFPALQTFIAGKLDKENFSGAFTVIRTEKCVFDVIMIAKPQVFEINLSIYQEFLKSLDGE